jgi:hypothetical protein
VRGVARRGLAACFDEKLGARRAAVERGSAWCGLSTNLLATCLSTRPPKNPHAHLSHIGEGGWGGFDLTAKGHVCQHAELQQGSWGQTEARIASACVSWDGGCAWDLQLVQGRPVGAGETDACGVEAPTARGLWTILQVNSTLHCGADNLKWRTQSQTGGWAKTCLAGCQRVAASAEVEARYDTRYVAHGT